MTIEKKYFHPEIKWYTRLCPWFWFGNIDDPVPIARFDGHYRDYWPYRWLRNIKVPHRIATKIWWGTRNPLHNFMFYVIGLVGRDIKVIGRNGLIDMFAPKGLHWLIITPVKHPWIKLPYISYYKSYDNDEEVKLYAGWGDSGQIGFELKGKRGMALVAWILIAAVVIGLVLGIYWLI